MNWTVFALVVPSIMVGLFGVLGCWLCFQLVHQNGRLLFRLEAAEQRVPPLGIQYSGAPGAPTPSGCGCRIEAPGRIASARGMAGAGAAIDGAHERLVLNE
jgi:hypothetical protein